eukprot:scaffold241964_cov51-Prasinocladus_malaysianus.AAC.1
MESLPVKLGPIVDKAAEHRYVLGGCSGVGEQGTSRTPSEVYCGDCDAHICTLLNQFLNLATPAQSPNCGAMGSR